MTDEGHTTQERDEEESGDGIAAFLAIGITFLSTALILGTAQGNWTVAIPFLGVGFTFFILGLSKRGAGRGSEDDEPDDADG